MNRHRGQVTGSLCLIALIILLAAALWLRKVLSGWTDRRPGVNHIPDNSLVLIPVTTGEEPFLLSYSVPLRMDISTNRCILELMDNGVPYSHEFIRQTNGTYLTYWNTTFVSYGSHVLQVVLCKPSRTEMYGPKRSETVTNLIQFDPASTSFGGRVCIDGKLHVPSADYRIEIYDTAKNLLKMINGHTDRGVIDEVWNLTTTSGEVRTDEEFSAQVYIRPTDTNGVGGKGSNGAPFSGPYPLPPNQ